MSGWTNDTIDTLIIPSDALPGEPQIVLGSDIPAELVAFYSGAGRTIVGALLFKLATGVYGYKAIITYPAGEPYMVEGVVNQNRGADDPILEMQAMYLGNTGSASGDGVLWLGGFKVGPNVDNPKIILNRAAQFEQDVEAFGNLFTIWGNCGIGGELSVLPGLLSLEAPRNIGTAGNPAFLNSWSNFAAGWISARFWSDAHGNVHVEGLVKPGVAWALNQTIFSTSGVSGYQPKSRHIFNCRSNGAGGVVRVDVTAAGDLILPESAGAPAVGGWISLQGITFRTDV